MTKEEFDHIILSIIEAAKGDPTIMTGLPPVDLSVWQLRFARALEICEKVETLRSIAEEEDTGHHYDWYNNLGLENVRDELTQYWASTRVAGTHVVTPKVKHGCGHMMVLESGKQVTCSCGKMVLMKGPDKNGKFELVEVLVAR